LKILWLSRSWHSTVFLLLALFSFAVITLALDTFPYRGSLRDQEEYLYIKICDFLTKGLSNHSSKELHKKGTSHNEHVNPSQYYFYGKNHKS
jgi:hypothetical protein